MEFKPLELYLSDPSPYTSRDIGQLLVRARCGVHLGASTQKVHSGAGIDKKTRR